LILESENYNPFFPIILLGWPGDIHYELHILLILNFKEIIKIYTLLFPLSISKEEYPIEKDTNMKFTRPTYNMIGYGIIYNNDLQNNN